jgi:low temperature requirement protein LtrA
MAEFSEGGAAAATPVLRHGSDRDRVTYMELFFDVVYVLAVTQLTGVFVHEPTLLGAVRTLLLLVALWWTWVDTAWITNWLDPDHLAVRLMLVGVMLCSLLISATLARSFGGRGLWFAGGYVALNLGRHAFALAALWGQPRLRRNLQPRLALWLAGLVVDTVAAAYGFYLPRPGRSYPSDWPISGVHLAERCYLFVILALGESILATGSGLATHEITPPGLAAVLLAFLNSVALWWIYFDRTAARASEVMAGSADAGSLGRSAYTYLHLPIIAGILMASVGNELVLARTGGPTVAATVLGGAALFLAGHVLFRGAVFGRLSVGRLAAIVALLALAPVAVLDEPILIIATVSAVLAALVVWETMSARRVPRDA